MNEPIDVQSFTHPARPNVGADDSEETTEESQTETETTEGDEVELEEGAEEGADEGGKPKGEPKKTPFHEHPRWKEREKDWNDKFDALKREMSEASAKEIQELKAQIATRKEENAELTEADIPDWFNGDLETYKKFDAHQTSRMQKMVSAAAKAAEENAVNRIKGESERETKAVQEATAWLESEISRLQDDPNLNPSGEPINRAELFAIAQENDLIDSKGRWNYQAAMKILAREQRNDGEDGDKNKQTLKKNIAAITTKKDSKGGGTQKRIASADSLKGKGWDDLDD